MAAAEDPNDKRPIRHCYCCWEKFHLARECPNRRVTVASSLEMALKETDIQVVIDGKRENKYVSVKQSTAHITPRLQRSYLTQQKASELQVLDIIRPTQIRSICDAKGTPQAVIGEVIIPIVLRIHQIVEEVSNTYLLNCLVCEQSEEDLVIAADFLKEQQIAVNWPPCQDGRGRGS